MIGKSEESTLYEHGLRWEEALACQRLVSSFVQEGSDESMKLALRYHERCTSICKAEGFREIALDVESIIMESKSSDKKDVRESEEELALKLKHYREKYQLVLEGCEQSGHDDIYSINSGVDLADALLEASHGIEAERLLMKLAATSNRVHGPDHFITRKVEDHLGLLKVREVQAMDAQGESRRFQLLRYDEQGRKCVIQGPMESPRIIEKECTQTIATEDIHFIMYGTPFICHGLEGSFAHLNGKIGEARGVNEEFDSYEVHFEDKDVEPCYIGPANVRVLFDLSEEN